MSIKSGVSPLFFMKKGKKKKSKVAGNIEVFIHLTDNRS